MKNFSDMGLPEEVVTSLFKLNLTSPTKIQEESIPLALQGCDILASSQTGSGKTLAYLLPAMSFIKKTSNKVLVLVPTRELAVQVCMNLNKVGRSIGISGVTIIGGEPMGKQLGALRSPYDVLIATPGRLIDHLDRGSIKLPNFSFLVLDEMDRMLDMGMKEQLEEIRKHMPKERQVLMFSATMPSHIMELANKYTKNPKQIAIGSSTKAAPEIEQEFIHIDDTKKYLALDEHLKNKLGTVIIFVKTKRGADKLARSLKDDDHKAEAMHGDLNQSRRSKVLNNFRFGKTRILVATDVAARGLDVDHVKFVFNYDLPTCAEDYLHRIGRTGRAGAKGHAISFVSGPDRSKLRAIERLVNKGESTARPTFAAKKSGGDSVGKFKNNSKIGDFNKKKPFKSKGGAPAFAGKKRPFGGGGAAASKGRRFGKPSVA